MNFAITNMEDFVTFYKHFPDLQEGQFFLFRDGIFPEWESEENIHGGRWSFCIPNKEKLRKMWILFSEGCVSESLLEEEKGVEVPQINGIEVCYKKGIIKIWTKTCPNIAYVNYGNSKKDKNLNLNLIPIHFSKEYIEHPSLPNIEYESVRFQSNGSSSDFAKREKV